MRFRLLPTYGFRTQATIAVILALIAGGAGFQLVRYERSALPADAALRVAGTVVTVRQLQHRIDVMTALYGLQQPGDAKQLDTFKRAVAKAVAVSDILDAAGQTRGINIPDKQATDQLTKLVTGNGYAGLPQFLQSIAAHGLSEQDVLNEIKQQEIDARLFAQVTTSVKASTDADAQGYYDHNKAQMVSPEQRGISNIVVSTQQQADQIAQLARAGTDFAALARQYSIDGSTKDNGGALGTVTAAQLESGYAKVAFAAAGGAAFGPVQTKQGWNVGKVSAVQPPVPLSFDQLKTVIKTKLDNDAKLRAWDDFLVGQIKAANVDYAADYRPANPDAPPDTNTPA
jgi:peptidyl-prolyl cis-trans isomerase C